jgi:hypothetical protein
MIAGYGNGALAFLDREAADHTFLGMPKQSARQVVIAPPSVLASVLALLQLEPQTALAEFSLLKIDFESP